jgi:Protein of unknown function (DUF1264)
MVPKHVYDTLPDEEKKLWHSHEFEVKSGMLILPKPATYGEGEWEQAELEAMEEIVGLYGKTWHFWEIDAGHEVPMGTLRSPLVYELDLGSFKCFHRRTNPLSLSLGRPHLMGSATHAGQVDLDQAMAKRNQTFGVHHSKKAEARKHIEVPAISERKCCTLRSTATIRESNVEPRYQFMVEAKREHREMSCWQANRVTHGTWLLPPQSLFLSWEDVWGNKRRERVKPIHGAAND